MNQPPNKSATVTHKAHLTPNMLRITFQGDDLYSPTPWPTGGYVKLMIPGTEGATGRPTVRTYTVRKHDPANKTLTVDFALHQPAGSATAWAIDAQVGDEINFMGPGPLRMDPSAGDWYLFSADMAALPAALAVMESLDADAKGYAFLEVTDEQDRQDLSIPEGIQLNWLIHPNPKVKSTQQLDAIRQIKHPAGVPNVFVAGELSTVREIKNYIASHEGFDDAHRYISSYWKIGLNEEEHKQAKRQRVV